MGPFTKLPFGWTTKWWWWWWWWWWWMMINSMETRFKSTRTPWWQWANLDGDRYIPPRHWWWCRILRARGHPHGLEAPISTSWNMGRSSNIHMQSLKFQPQDNTVKFWGQKISGWLPCFCYQNVWFFWCWFNHGSFPLNLECDQSTAYFTHSTLSYEGKGANRRPQQLPSAAKNLTFDFSSGNDGDEAKVSKTWNWARLNLGPLTCLGPAQHHASLWKIGGISPTKVVKHGGFANFMGSYGDVMMLPMGKDLPILWKSIL